MGNEARDELVAVAELVERLAGTTTGGDWRSGGLLASRPEVVSHYEDGSTEHVAEARAGSARWVTAFSPALAPSLTGWLRSAAEADEFDQAALSFARTLRSRLSGGR